ncbi:MAG TPA: hypothetical protein VEV42_14905, partial [Pyrinomonadaceae bacterium]|nr:hypothetical protein [Pyrinomonadaceae bacterium]
TDAIACFINPHSLSSSCQLNAGRQPIWPSTDNDRINWRLHYSEKFRQNQFELQDCAYSQVCYNAAHGNKEENKHSQLNREEAFSVEAFSSVCKFKENEKGCIETLTACNQI